MESAALARKPDSDQKKVSRDQLLRAAGALMTERGTIDVSLSEIAKRSGLNSALVKYYFGNKNGLLLALLNDVIGRGLHQMRDLLDMDVHPIDKLKLHVRGIIAVYFRYPFVNRLIHFMFEDAELGPQVAEAISKPLADTQRQLLEQGIAAGYLKPIDPMMFYFLVLGACDQLFFGRHILKTAFGITEIDDALHRRYATAILDIILSGILEDRPPANPAIPHKRLALRSRALD